MTIGELIAEFCRNTGMTNQRFAEKCSVSKGYISQLINGKNPKTGRPITPTIETYIKIAETMNMTLDELFRKIDDVPVALKNQSQNTLENIGEQLTRPSKSKEWRMISAGFEKMEKENYNEFMAYLNMLTTTRPDLFNERNDDDDPES